MCVLEQQDHAKTDVRFFQYFSPCYPLLPRQLLEPEELSNLIINEPILLGVIICIVSRYRHRLDGTDGQAAIMYVSRRLPRACMLMEAVLILQHPRRSVQMVDETRRLPHMRRVCTPLTPLSTSIAKVRTDCQPLPTESCIRRRPPPPGRMAAPLAPPLRPLKPRTHQGPVRQLVGVV